MMKKTVKIAIDGPVGSGKGTLAIELARRLSAVYIYTGGMYRALALNCLNNNVDIHNKEQVIDLLKKTLIDLRIKESDTKVFLNDQDVTAEIFLPKVSNITPIVSAYPEVRSEMVARQKRLIGENSTVIEGRDIASEVMPNADLKVYLTADIETRVKRRFTQLQEKNVQISLEQVKKDVEDRDRRDEGRDASPLKKVNGAIVIDTTNDTINQTVEKVMQQLKQKGFVE